MVLEDGFSSVVWKWFELVFKLLGACSCKPIKMLRTPKIASNKCFVNKYGISVLLKCSDVTEIIDVVATRRERQLQMKREREGITWWFRDGKCGQWTACAETELYLDKELDFPTTEMNVLIGNMIRSWNWQEED